MENNQTISAQTTIGSQSSTSVSQATDTQHTKVASVTSHLSTDSSYQQQGSKSTTIVENVIEIVANDSNNRQPFKSTHSSDENISSSLDEVTCDISSIQLTATSTKTNSSMEKNPDTVCDKNSGNGSSIKADDSKRAASDNGEKECCSSIAQPIAAVASTKAATALTITETITSATVPCAPGISSRVQSVGKVNGPPTTSNVPVFVDRYPNNHPTYLPPHFRNLPKTQSLDLADGDPELPSLLPKMQSFEANRPIYPNVPYSPYGSPFGSPRMGRRRAPLRESRRISIEQSGSFLQLNQYKLMDQIGQVSNTLSQH